MRCGLTTLGWITLPAKHFLSSVGDSCRRSGVLGLSGTTTRSTRRILSSACSAGAATRALQVHSFMETETWECGTLLRRGTMRRGWSLRRRARKKREFVPAGLAHPHDAGLAAPPRDNLLRWRFSQCGLSHLAKAPCLTCYLRFDGAFWFISLIEIPPQAGLVKPAEMTRKPNA